MAEEKKMSKGERRYSKPAKIAPKEGGDTGGKAGEMPKDKKEAEKTAGSPKPQPTSAGDPGPKGDAMNGADGVSVHERHNAERADMYSRHEKEMTQMQGRHSKEHSSMHDRHHDELSKLAATGGGAAEKEKA